MTLPENFNPRDHLINQITYWHNLLVSHYFVNEQPNDLSTSKASLRLACTITPDDTDAMILQRQWLFEITVGHAQSLQAPIMGIPSQEYQRDSKFSPQVKMYFKEVYNYEKFVVQGLRPVLGEISFRLPHKTSATINQQDATQYANRIKNIFITEKIIWHKGHFKCTYYDLANGLDLRMYALDKASGQAMAQAVLAVASVPYDASNFQFIENSGNYPTNPGNQTVYGSEMEKPVKRPIANLSLSYAHLLIWGRITPVNLVSVGMRLKNAIVSV